MNEATRIEFRIGDVFDRLAEIPNGSIDLIVTSPPFVALRSYLPADHPDKAKEIGSEPTPAAFLDTMMALTAEWRRVLAPHGSLCVELGDTYSGSGGGGGDYLPGGLREGQPGFDGSNAKAGNAAHWRAKNAQKNAWPLAKSMCGIPTLYPWSLAYGHNLLNPATTVEPWRIRNVIVWARANPPVGALGDKFRPATSYITVAAKGAKRYFDLDAVRTGEPGPPRVTRVGQAAASKPGGTDERRGADGLRHTHNPAGAPPLDWHSDIDDGPNGDRLWWLNTAPYKGSHYAAFPEELPRRLIEAMCPQRVCVTCGKPSERIAHTVNALGHAVGRNGATATYEAYGQSRTTAKTAMCDAPSAIRETTGWTDCHHDNWRAGVVLDPFGGSGTTGAAAQGLGRSAILIDIDARNADLARERVGMFLEVQT